MEPADASQVVFAPVLAASQVLSVVGALSVVPADDVSIDFVVVKHHVPGGPEVEKRIPDELLFSIPAELAQQDHAKTWEAVRASFTSASYRLLLQHHLGVDSQLALQEDRSIPEALVARECAQDVLFYQDPPLPSPSPPRKRARRYQLLQLPPAPAREASPPAMPPYRPPSKYALPARDAEAAGGGPARCAEQPYGTQVCQPT